MQEYFYDAPAKLKQVLGNEFIVVENRSFSFIDNLEGEEFIKTIQRVVNSEKRQNEIGD
jgi:5-methylcytosine-specific restriction protein B